jgi:benzylsuccinate CoA-transferase BbsF subunit
VGRRAEERMRVMPGALEGIRVIEIGQAVSAPYCAKLFADYGADVIKVEPPEGDISRSWGPFPGDEPHPEKSGLFFFLNSAKRGIGLDLCRGGDRVILRNLLAGADVLIENADPSQLAAWGLDLEEMTEAYPELVTISITPFGRSGPYSRWRGYDLNAFHLTAAGSRYVGKPDRAPLEPAAFVADFHGAVAGAAWGMGALLGRENVGGGQRIDVSCAEVMAAIFTGCQNIGSYALLGEFSRRTGIGMAYGAPATILPCRDGYVWMIALEPGQWQGLAKAMGEPDWMQLEVFQDMFSRAQNQEAMYPLLREWTAAHSKQDIMDACQQNGCPTTAVYSISEAAEHPHLRERRYLEEVDHTSLGRMRTLAPPFRLANNAGLRRPAPLLGQHNEEVLREATGRNRKGGGARKEGGKARSRGRLPLEGIRVTNFGWVWAGPVAGQTLSMLGAEVFKVESRARLDLTRTLPPFIGGERDPDRSVTNHSMFAGNGSVSLNLAKPEGRDLALRLVAVSDVVIENFGPGAMEGMGLGYGVLRRARPDIVYISMPPAGQTGPLKNVRTYGMTLTSITGLDSMTGYLDGVPVPFENAYADPYNGLLGAYAVMLALRERGLTGKGQHVDYSQLEGIMQMAAPAFMDYFMNGRSARPRENRHPLGAGAPHGVFPCAGDDRWISIAVMNDEEWSGLVEAMGYPEWAQSSDFSTGASRVAGSDSLHQHLAAWTAGFDDRDLAERLQAKGVAAAPVLNVADLLGDPHFRHRGTFIEVQHPLGFTETIYGAYVKMSRTQPRVRPGPAIGQDNERAIKGLLGVPGDEYERLVAEQVIY